MRFMQEMMELSSQQQKEQLPPRAIQIVSHPFFGRVVLTAGPAQFGTDLSKSSTGVSGFCPSFSWLLVFQWELCCPYVYFPKRATLFSLVFLREHFYSKDILLIQKDENLPHNVKMSSFILHNNSLSCPDSFPLCAGTWVCDCG